MLTDKEALDQIAAELDGREWTPEDLDTVASLVRATGRPVRGVEEDEEA